MAKPTPRASELGPALRPLAPRRAPSRRRDRLVCSSPGQRSPRHPSSSFRSPRVDDLNVIDQFMQAFIAYIDSGFGLLGGDVGFLTTILIGIDITLAGLFWALGGEDDVIGKFLKKILYVGALDRKSTRLNSSH